MKIVNRIHFIIFTFLVLILVSALIAAGLFFYGRYQIFTPVNDSNLEQTFVIHPGEGSEEIAERLEEEGLIRDNLWFDVYVFYKGWDDNLQAGEYVLTSSMTLHQIALKMIGGEVKKDRDVRVTIPEGFDVKKIDARLAQKGLIEAGQLISFESESLDKPQLEGYLFPDTYLFDKEAEIKTIVLKMFKNFDRKITEKMIEDINEQGRTLEQVITMASIVEKEVKTYQDQQIVAGIFWKRIDNNYPLQSCATIAYALDLDKWRYSREDLEVDSPYNTYKNAGLPFGPICNPGLSAIKATIYFKETDYNYFLSKPNGETVFSETLEEHNENKARYLD